ncbi:MAG: MotA/TolQ/ExbB proton channel family protein [Elusimicrobia bacterium]|nr:MotA/TolQ/ExbB proton channel family protein [Elusimicrobiota bacterium]
MDTTTIFGLLAFAALAWSVSRGGQLFALLMNWHALAIVFGGTFAATLINTPARFLGDVLRAFASLLARPAFEATDEIVAAMVAMSEQARIRGLSVLRDPDPALVRGFLARSCQVCLEKNDPRFVRRVLEDQINRDFDHQNEITNVIRAMSVLAPMFGLVGTLIGIVEVLRQLSDPQQAGMAMGVAITSALYGILLANVLLVPAAGKLRIRAWQELLCKSLVMEGLLEIMEGTIPMQVERRLKALARERETAVAQ